MNVNEDLRSVSERGIKPMLELREKVLLNESWPVVAAPITQKYVPLIGHLGLPAIRDRCYRRRAPHHDDSHYTRKPVSAIDCSEFMRSDEGQGFLRSSVFHPVVAVCQGGFVDWSAVAVARVGETSMVTIRLRRLCRDLHNALMGRRPPSSTSVHYRSAPSIQYRL